MGLQPAEDSHTVLVSDGGAPFVAAVPHGVFGRLKAYLSVMGKQSGALRRRHLIAEFKNKEKSGAYWGIDSAPEKYVNDLPPDQKIRFPDGYTKRLATSRIASIRTDLDSFSSAEISVLENHGYCLADVALRAYARNLISIHDARFAVPYPNWMDETLVDEALRYSNKRFRIVRWFYRTAYRAKLWILPDWKVLRFTSRKFST
jgi:hypothetical protein